MTTELNRQDGCFRVGASAGTCFTDKVLEKFKQLAGDESFSKSTESLIEHMKKRTNCSTEFCILEKMKPHLAEDEYVENKKVMNPIGPAKTIEWLYDSDVENFFAYHIHEKPNFIYTKCQYMSFVFNEMPPSNLDIIKVCEKRYKSNLKKSKDADPEIFIGTVLNTARDGGGEHWVPFLIQYNVLTKKGSLEYFNSSGQGPDEEEDSPEVMEWINTFCDKRKKTEHKRKPRLKIKINKTQKQYGETECGLYSLFYIIHRIMGFTFEEFVHSKILDEKMMAFREKVFSANE